uniref:Uncharacterized protein n=1 Tax=Tanacetum cinerariifolium TaxID=118510 RepID=A0A699HLK6_TANCI|nr:hypothetical protein [Tanacetum cinerariifolium]GEY55582.1 hypothetical protein [Tanacetum cinerariifolium]
MFTMIKLVSRHQNIQQYSAILHIELMNEAIRNFESYKEYYAIASGAEPPKTKVSIRKKQSNSDTTMPPLTAKGKRLKTSANVDKPAKEKKPAKTSKAKGLTVLSKKSSEDNDDDEVNMSEHDEDVDDQSDYNDQNDDDDDDQNNDDDEQTNSDNDVQTPSYDEKTDDEDNDEDSHGMNVEGDEMDDEVEIKRMTLINYTKTSTAEFVCVISICFEHAQPKSRFSIQKIIKEQVKEQVKAQVVKILPKIEKTVNEQLEAKVLNRSSNSSKPSHDVAANLFELELKKILIEKMESNKSIHISNEQKNLYKALVDAYKCDKLILDTYGDTITLKRRQDC